MKKLLVALVVMLLCASAAMADPGVAYIDGLTSDRVHLRAEPSTEADSHGLYFTGTDVIVVERWKDWSWVMVGDESGYIMTKYLAAERPVRLGPWVVVDNHSSTWVNLRMSPSMQGTVAMRPENGTEMQLLGETADGWSYVDCDGVKGYIMTSLLSEAKVARPASTVVLGRTADASYIHQYTASNGQKIYFTAADDDVYITVQDVNFDGLQDIVVSSAAGVNHQFSEFFVYEKVRREYVRAAIGGAEELLCNYQLHPECGVVSTYANGGHAGLLHVQRLYRWAGNELRLIRSAVSDEWTEEFIEGQTLTSVIHGDMLHITVRDHTNPYEETVLWEIVISKEDTEYRDVFNEETEALWQGIR